MDTSSARFELGIERFVLGDSITFDGVRFHLHRGMLTVDTSSEWQPERTTPEMARDAIARGKAVLESLKAKSAAFRNAVDGLPVEHTFGADDVIMAKETRGELKWVGK